VGAARVQATLHELGADSVRVLRGVEDNVAYRAGLNNTTTARGLGIVMQAIAGANAASAQSSGAMMQILMRQRFNDGIPAGLPRHTRVAHKTGWLTGVHHDAAVVYYRDRPRYVLIILTRGLQEESASAQLMADLARMVHRYAIPETVPKAPYRPRTAN
jgi:beta-lactamase class A